MAINKYEEMNEMERDVIREIGSIGNGNAATALSSMLEAKVKMTLPEVNILEFNAAMNHLGDPEDVVAAILVEMSGEIQGIMLFILTQDFADEILKRMLGKDTVDFLALDEIDTSVLTEIGNIMISSYINALSSLTNVNVVLSVPQLAVNMLGGILSLPMATMGINSDRIMMITGEFKIDGRELNSDMLLLPDVDSLNVLMKKLGVE
ncbi:chemotaxis protein CheC [Luxibacter massiliensis]|uniref:chemotaxis protein CheC n=1 Tax=Luxibacter massiliensis TaxID=2219695 RepID=UPI000F06E212|nr:chemotaxis protein CheC [Luxibacter massiliensis]